MVAKIPSIENIYIPSIENTYCGMNQTHKNTNIQKRPSDTYKTIVYFPVGLDVG